MNKQKSILIAVLAISLLTAVLSNHCLAAPCYLPLIVSNPGPIITPVTPELVVGTWIMTNVDTGVIDFFLHIGADNSLAINDYPSDRDHLPGNWGITDGVLLGHFININLNPEKYNPNGDLVGEIVDGVFKLDFIEYWHDPPKHIPYTASRP